MTHFFIRNYRNRPWEVVEGGPYPITVEEFYTARQHYLDYMEQQHQKDPVMYPSMWGCGTVGREFLQHLHLKGFDLLILGNLVAARHVKVESARPH